MIGPLLLIAALACAPGDGGDGQLDVDVSLSEDIPTVLTVRWTTDEQGSGVVDFGSDLEETATATQLEDGSWEAVLVGFPPQSEARYRVRHGDLVHDGVVETGEAPSWVPLAPTTTGEGQPGYLLTGYRSQEGRGALIVNRWGEAVWWADALQFGSDTYVTRVLLDPAGDAVWFNTIELRQAPADADVSLGVVRVSLDGSEVEHLPLEELHHDFWLHDDGRIAYLSTAPAEVEGTEVTLDALRRWSPDGTDEVLYTPEDVVTIDTLEPWLNSVEYEAEADRYWVGAKSMSAIFRIDAQTGELTDLIGGPRSTWEVDEPTMDQHGFDLVEGGVLIFDNGDIRDGDSRPALFAMDEEAKTAERVWEYAPESPLYTNFLGDAVDLGDGRVLSTWTYEGVVHQVEADGTPFATWEYRELEMLTYGRFVDQVVP